MFRFFTSDLRRNLTKILCLTIGLAIGFILVAKIYVEASFDHIHPDAARLFLVKEAVTIEDEYKDYNSTAGAIGPGLKRYAPMVEAATRSTPFLGAGTIRMADGRTFEIEGVSLADSCFFDIFRQEILAGNPREALAVDATVMIPRSLAERIGGDPVGQTFTADDITSDFHVTIGGVYEDFPINSSIPNTIFLSLPTIVHFSYDGRENWAGNDRYQTVVRLAPSATPADLRPYAERMLADNIDAETLTRLQYKVVAVPFTDLHRTDSGVSTMLWVMGILATVILVSAALNFLLIVIGQMSRRQKEMAIRRCYGTPARSIFGRIMAESAFFLAISVLLAILIVLSFSDECMRLVGFSAVDILTAPGVWAVEIAVCASLFVITGIIPAWLYCHTPVASVFRQQPRSRRRWRLALLFVQFFASAMLLCLVELVGRQYHMLGSSDPGYDPTDLAMLGVDGTSQKERAALLARLRALPSVKGAATAYQDFTAKASGNNMWIDDPEHQVNLADLYGAEASITDVVGMEIVGGRGFSEGADSTINEVIVEERMIDVLRDRFGVAEDDVIGQTFFLTEHYEDGVGHIPLTIVGIVRNMRRGGFSEGISDTRPGVFFPTRYLHDNLYIRFNRLSPEAMAEAQAIVNETFPERELYIVPMRSILDAQFETVRNFGISVGVAGLAIILITLIGLIGYTADEVNRRAREIAIRKVNGTPTLGIIRLFVVDIIRVAIPATALGAVAAAVVGHDWLSQFTVRVGLAPWLMVLSVIVIIVVLGAVTALNALRIARANPVEFLRDE